MKKGGFPIETNAGRTVACAPEPLRSDKENMAGVSAGGMKE